MNYVPHSGCFYSDIGNGRSNKVDFVMIKPNDSKNGVMVLKHRNWVAVYSFLHLYNEKARATVLLSKDCGNEEDAYTKMMKVIGKMIKKSGAEDEKGHIARYYNNRQDKAYEVPPFIGDERLMTPVYKTMNTLKVQYFE